MRTSKFAPEQILQALRQAESGYDGRRHLPQARCDGDDVLPVEAAVRRVGRERAARAEIAARREPAAEAGRRRSDARQKHSARRARKKMVSPAQRRAVVDWARQAYRVSERRACRALRVHARWSDIGQ